MLCKNGVSLLQKQNVLFFLSFVWFCHILLELQVVLGPASSLTDVRLQTHLVSQADHHRWTYVRGSSAAKLAWNANCAYSKTDTAMQGDTKLIERWMKIMCFKLMWQDSSLTWILECSCVKCSFVWFCLCCIFAFSEVKPTQSWAMSLCQVVSPQFCYNSVIMVYYIILNIVIDPPQLSCRNLVWQQFNCA